MSVFDDRICHLGEGPLWHPERNQFFWFDIMGRRLLSRTEDGPLEWDMGEHASAAGWIDRDTLLIATETGLFRFDLTTGGKDKVADLEPDQPLTRSNDGRADPFGGFWIGTMGKAAEPRAGAIYRFFEGRIEKLFDQISIPNAICFAPDGQRAYYADTPRQRVWQVALDDKGWLAGEPEVFLDLRDEGLNPDGAVTDAEGGVWVAQWGASRVARYLPDGRYDRAIDLPARQTSCPCFGGPDLDQLYVTSATENMPDPGPADGQTFVVDPGLRGIAAPRVIL
ncbi:SMP-30/gluconolactonase/LRE family protein [Pseudooceanicola sp.]|uniref:SMP-30/gluconolactonase/LRE family protein n=1 Tax=Pseudooceanicola sp. TaxID=1914328 RepID=UPI0035C6B68A